MNAEPVVDVKPILENRHVPVLGGKRNPVIYLGFARVKPEVVETEDVKPRGLGPLKSHRSDDEVLLYHIISVVFYGLS